jgi:hypothetical protein
LCPLLGTPLSACSSCSFCFVIEPTSDQTRRGRGLTWSSSPLSFSLAFTDGGLVATVDSPKALSGRTCEIGASEHAAKHQS